MPRTRLDLDEELRTALGSENVYYQPPESIKLKYPCIIYSRDLIDAKYADNKTYNTTNRYDVVIISKDPDFPLFDEFIHLFPMCRYDRSYTVDNLNHTAFSLYY